MYTNMFITKTVFNRLLTPTICFYLPFQLDGSVFDTLQSKVHNAVQYFNIGPHCVPTRDKKRCLLKIELPINMEINIYRNVDLYI